MKNLDLIIDDLNKEIVRSKQFLDDNGYHHGTSVYVIISRYRKELKELRNTIADDNCLDGIHNYSECEKIEKHFGVK
jgi:hypothetical protein